MKKKIRQSVRTIGRKAVCKLGWHENRDYCGLPKHAPPSFRRGIVRSARSKENHNLRSAIAKGDLGNYEPLYIAKRDADWLYF